MGTFIQMLVLAISSQKGTLIVYYFTHLEEKRLNIFWTKIGDFGHSENNTKQTTNRAKFFSVKLQQHKNNSIFLCKSIYIAYLIYEFFCTLCFFKYICFFSYGCFLNSNYSKQQIVILVI